MIRQSSRALPGGVDRLLDVEDAALGAADDALVLLLQAAGEHDVGVVRGLGEERSR